ncbi:DUF1090 domain-containing protein [Entomohabitans teleogrylli]|uniref:DUF1090 domain-containing protein n=1 Tax=Entomohabitans teleogrylli TaxID=1384589 RepID=UPI00073D785A|nr:DUF1090 domain-containing protein [Entomohabitans teleogrylli]
MKKVIGSCLLLVVAFSASAGQYQNGCEIKKSNILRQIEYAKQYGNYHRVAGLNRALANVERYCHGAPLSTRNDDAWEKIRDKEKKVSERRQELEQAKLKGDTEKISKKALRLIDAQEELNQALAEL